MSSRFDINSSRLFGVEIELNSFDQRDFNKFPLNETELPLGSVDLGLLISNELGYSVEVGGWRHLAFNEKWTIKPDRSCGFELCSPPTNLKNGIQSLRDVIRLLRKDGRSKSDSRCSFHVTVSLADLLFSRNEIRNFNLNFINEKVSDQSKRYIFLDKEYYLSSSANRILQSWIKAESIFLDAVHGGRKFSKYCEAISLSGDIDVADSDSKDLISVYSNYKYRTANTYHFKAQRRPTLEYRIVGEDACLNEWIACNWVKIFLLFTERSLESKNFVSYSSRYRNGGYSWFSLNELFFHLGFDQPLSESLIQLRNWLLVTLYKNCMSGKPGTPFGPEFRENSYNEICQMMDRFNLKKNKEEVEYWENPDNDNWIY